MNQIVPYKTIAEALQVLDNGGRFYNLFTKADDGIITTAEIAKVAGVFSGKQQSILYFSAVLSQLDKKAQEEILEKTDKDVKAIYLQYKPQFLLPSEAVEKGVVSANAIITGVPKLVDAKTEFKGFIIVPIAAGKVMTMILVPIMDRYDVYELRDHNTAETFLIAHARGEEKLPEELMKVAGIIKELKADKKEELPPKKFLEALYYFIA